jgi:hypothetical protein
MPLLFQRPACTALRRVSGTPCIPYKLQLGMAIRDGEIMFVKSVYPFPGLRGRFGLLQILLDAPEDETETMEARPDDDIQVRYKATQVHPSSDALDAVDDKSPVPRRNSIEPENGMHDAKEGVFYSGDTGEADTDRKQSEMNEIAADKRWDDIPTPNCDTLLDSNGDGKEIFYAMLGKVLYQAGNSVLDNYWQIAPLMSSHGDYPRRGDGVLCKKTQTWNESSVCVCDMETVD